LKVPWGVTGADVSDPATSEDVVTTGTTIAETGAITDSTRIRIPEKATVKEIF
jgi:hypothetical protein